jgi:glycosyltransferase involved in cell wall biosynthesis
VKLAIVIPGFQAGPQDWCIPAFTNLAQELSRRNEVHVFALRYPPERANYTIGPVRVHALGGGQVAGKRVPVLSLGKLWADTLRAIAKEHSSGPFDVIVGIWATESGWLAAQAGSILDVPSHVHLAGGELVYFPSIRYGYLARGLDGILLNHALALADRITAPSRQLLNIASTVFPQVMPKAVRWPLGVDTALFGQRTPEPGPTQPFTFITVGSLIPVKNHTWLLRSFADLRKRRPDLDVRLVLAGDGPLRPHLLRLARAPQLREYVTSMGDVRHDDLPGVYGRARAFVLGSWHEAQCMAALEAMSAGLPWIAPPVGALADIAQDQQRGGSISGVLVPERSIYAMSRAMEGVADLPQEVYARWSANAAGKVRRDYDLATQTQRLERLLARLTQIGRG